MQVMTTGLIIISKKYRNKIKNIASRNKIKISLVGKIIRKKVYISIHN